MQTTCIVQVTSTAILENQFQPKISVFPNPASDLITIKALSNAAGVTFIIIDLTGRQVLNGMLNDKNTSIGISQLLTGLYFFQNGKKNKQTFKIIMNANQGLKY